MKTKTVMSDEMLSVLALRVARSMPPEPHSCQDGLHLIVPYDEFVKLCLELPQFGENILMQSSRILSERAQSNEASEYSVAELKVYYMREVAMAQLREISYQQQYGKGLTKISHFPQGAQSVDSGDIFLEYYDNPKLLDNLLEESSRLGYPINIERADSNSLNLMLYAYALYESSGNFIKYN